MASFREGGIYPYNIRTLCIIIVVYVCQAVKFVVVICSCIFTDM